MLLWCQNTFYKVLSIFLVCHVPGTMPSLPIFPYLDSTHKNESNCIYYMVVSNQHLDREITLYQLVLKCYFLHFGHLFRCQVPVLSFPCSYLYFQLFFPFYFTGFGEELILQHTFLFGSNLTKLVYLTIIHLPRPH